MNISNDLAEIFEVDFVNDEDLLSNFDCWDSLTVLSLIAYFDQSHKLKLSAEEIRKCKTISDLKQLLL